MENAERRQTSWSNEEHRGRRPHSKRWRTATWRHERSCLPPKSPPRRSHTPTVRWSQLLIVLHCVRTVFIHTGGVTGRNSTSHWEIVCAPPPSSCESQHTHDACSTEQASAVALNTGRTERNGPFDEASEPKLRRQRRWRLQVEPPGVDARGRVEMGGLGGWLGKLSQCVFCEWACFGRFTERSII